MFLRLFTFFIFFTNISTCLLVVSFIFIFILLFYNRNSSFSFQIPFFKLFLIYFLQMYLLNLLGLRWLIKLCRFQVSSYIIHHLYSVLRAHHPQSISFRHHLRSLCPLSPSTPFTSGNHHPVVCATILFGGRVCL